MNNPAPQSPSTPAAAQAVRATTRASSAPKFDWKRFWIQSAILVLVFNIVAGFVTWYFIFPHLFPGRQ